MNRADEAFFAAFVNERSPAMLSTARLLVGDRAAAEDLLQTALIKTYLAWGRIRDRGAVEAYVRRAMVTTAISFWRSRRYREYSADCLPESVDHNNSTESYVERAAMLRQLGRLPVKQRAVLVLRYYEGLAEAEIADVLGLSRGTVKSHASRGLTALRKHLTAIEAEATA